MIKNIYKVTQLLAFVPFMAIPSISVASHIGSLEINPVTKVEISVEDIRKEKAEIIMISAFSLLSPFPYGFHTASLRTQIGMFS